MPTRRPDAHRRPSRSPLRGAVLALALALPLLPAATASAAPVSAARVSAAAPVVTLPWHARRDGGLDQVALDDTVLGRTVAAECAGGGPVYATDVTLLIPSKSTKVIAEQVTSSMLAHTTAAERNGLAVLAADGHAVACLADSGTQHVTFPVTKNVPLRLVQFLQRTDVLGESWQQETALMEAKIKTPTNDSPATAVTLATLPAKLKVDNRLATSSSEDWSLADSDCTGMWDFTYGLGRTLWYRYTPVTTQTVLLQPSSSTAVAAVAEETPAGLSWTPGVCALTQRPGDVVATLSAGHSYLISVGVWFADFDHSLMDGVQPATVAIRRVVPNRKTVFISAPMIDDDTDVTSTVTCPIGGTFVVHGWVSGPDATGVQAFDSSGTCTGGFEQWWGSVQWSIAPPADLFTVAVVTSAKGGVTAVGPADVHVG